MLLQQVNRVFFMKSLYDYKKNLEQDGIIFSFSGPMSHDVIEGIGSAIRVKIGEGEGGNRNVALKVFSIFVEQVENVIHYSAEKYPQDGNMSFGIVVVGKKDGIFFISGGNKIDNNKVNMLQDYLTRLASMSKDELKSYYKQRRREEKLADSKGGGIGFIEMARKASSTLQFDFQKIDDDHSFFTIKIEI